jgi:hypothetical protein
VLEHAQHKKVVALAADQATLSAASFKLFFQHTRAVVTAETPLSVEHRVASVMVLADLHLDMHEVRTQRTGRDLQLSPTERYRIVLADLALFLHAQDLFEIDPGDRNKRRSLLLRLHREPGIMGRDVDRADKPVGGFDVGDPSQRQLLNLEF